MPDNKAQIVGGGRVASGDELAKILDDFVKQNADSPEAQRIKLDVAKHGDARIHSISMDLEGEAKEYLADGNVHIAIRGDAAFFAIGGDSLEAVKAAIDKSGKPVANRPPVSFRIQPSKFVAIFGKGDDPNLELARQAFSGDGDHISMELMPIDRGARLRFELGEGFLRFIALAVSQQLGE